MEPHGEQATEPGAVWALADFAQHTSHLFFFESHGTVSAVLLPLPRRLFPLLTLSHPSGLGVNAPSSKRPSNLVRSPSLRTHWIFLP